MNIDEIIVPTSETMLGASLEPRITIEDRTLIIPPELQTIGVEYDSDVERIFFEIPRYVDEVNDLSTFDIYIHYINAAGNGDIYHCDDVAIENDNIVFSWLTGRSLYSSTGKAKFAIRAYGKDNNKNWGTTVAELNVQTSINVENIIVEQDYDFVNQLFNSVEQTIDRRLEDMIEVLTSSQYEALEVKDPNKTYLVHEEGI